MTKGIEWIGLVVFIVICLGAGGLGAIATTQEIEGWYKTLEKPSWNPPNNVFSPVWTTHFVMMAIVAGTVCKPERFKAAMMPLTLFALRLGLNVAWSWIFFGMHQPGWAFVEIVVLWLAIVVIASNQKVFLGMVIHLEPRNERVDSLSYPCEIEHDGHRHVGYSNN